MALMLVADLACEAVDPHAEKTMVLLRAAGAFRRVLPHLFTDEQDRLTLVYALGALQNLCTEITCVEQLELAGGLERLQAIIELNDPRLDPFARGCLANAQHFADAQRLANAQRLADSSDARTAAPNQADEGGNQADEGGNQADEGGAGADEKEAAATRLQSRARGRLSRGDCRNDGRADRVDVIDLEAHVADRRGFAQHRVDVIDLEAHVSGLGADVENVDDSDKVDDSGAKHVAAVADVQSEVPEQCAADEPTDGAIDVATDEPTVLATNVAMTAVRQVETPAQRAAAATAAREAAARRRSEQQAVAEAAAREAAEAAARLRQQELTRQETLSKLHARMAGRSIRAQHAEQQARKFAVRWLQRTIL